MIKIVGALVLVAGSTGTALLAVRQLEERVKTLKTLANALDLFVYELDFGLPSTAQLLANTAMRVQEPVSSFLNACIHGMECGEGIPFSEVWKQAALKELPALKQNDIETVMTIGTVLGRYDAESQKSTILAARKMLMKHLTEALEEKSRRGKVYGALGTVGGALIAILLI